MYKIEKIEECKTLLDKKGGHVVPIEDMFDKLMEVHKITGYSDRSVMKPEAEKKYANITRVLIELFCEYSEEFQLKKKKNKNNGLVVKVD